MSLTYIPTDANGYVTKGRTDCYEGQNGVRTTAALSPARK